MAVPEGLADEHVMGFLGQHEPAGTRQRVERGFRETLQLKLAVGVGEVGKAQEGQPVFDPAGNNTDQLLRHRRIDRG